MSDFILPGESITSEQGYLRGHGAYLQHSLPDGEQDISTEPTEAKPPEMVSSVAGYITRVDKLISVQPVKARYVGDVGDLVVGRIKAVDSKRWRVDINGRRDAILQLSSINLPGGIQRMKTYEDQLSMRELFVEGDLVCAEIQNVNAEGVVSLHTRSLKYGKLENGQVIQVSSHLIRRLPHHYVSLESPGVDIILGRNGMIWITRSIPDTWTQENADMQDEIAPLAETLQKLRARHASTPLTKQERLNVARTRNVILALSQSGRALRQKRKNRRSHHHSNQSRSSINSQQHTFTAWLQDQRADKLKATSTMATVGEKTTETTVVNTLEEHDEAGVNGRDDKIEEEEEEEEEEEDDDDESDVQDLEINPDSILSVYETSIELHREAVDLLQPHVQIEVTRHLRP